MSGLGASEFKMDEWKLDIVCAASQKALACPPGLAMVAVSSRAWKKIKANRAPRFYFDLQKHKEFFDKGEPPWTPPVSVAFALDVAIDLYERERPRNVGHVTHATPTRFIKLLRHLGCRSSHVTACIRSPSRAL